MLIYIPLSRQNVNAQAALQAANVVMGSDEQPTILRIIVDHAYFPISLDILYQVNTSFIILQHLYLLDRTHALYSKSSRVKGLWRLSIGLLEIYSKLFLQPRVKEQRVNNTIRKSYISTLGSCTYQSS